MTQVGKITKVIINEDDNEVRVNVSLSPTQHPDKIPYRMPSKDVWFVPEVGDVVEVADVGKYGKVAFAPKSPPTSGLPENLSEGDVAFRLNDETVLHFSESNGQYDISIKCDGDLQLDAANILIGEDGARVPVAPANHTHDYTWTDAGGSGTTNQMNEEPTDTTIE
jgi:hypothetical protein